MFCPNCGKTVDKKLRYCNGCGELLVREDEDKEGTPGKMLEKITTTLCVVVVFGLGILVGLVAVMLGSVKIEVVVTIVLAYLTAVFGICFMLARQIPKLIDAKLKGWNNTADIRTHQQLSPPRTAQLEEFRQPIGSVTDHTTKTLDEIPIRGR